MSQALRQFKKAFARLLASGRVDEEKVISLMVSIRRLVEADRAKTSFPTLWFYCNWCLHSEIESGLTKPWLTRISKVIGELTPNPWYTDKVAEIMSLDILRAELIQLFRDKNLEQTLFESAGNWRVLVSGLLNHVVGTPLVRNDKTPPDSEHRFWIMSLRLGVVGTDPALNYALADPRIKKGNVFLIMHGVYDDIEGKYPPSQNPDRNITICMPHAIPEHDAEFRFP